MAEEKFDPVKEFVNLRDTLGKTVEQQIKNIVGVQDTPYPPVDIYEIDDAVIVRTSFLNGQKPQDIEISMEDGILEIQGKTTDSLDVADGTFLHKELIFGKFYRAIKIPVSIKADEASANFTDGMLIIKLPKRDRSKIVEITPTD